MLISSGAVHATKLLTLQEDDMALCSTLYRRATHRAYMLERCRDTSRKMPVCNIQVSNVISWQARSTDLTRMDTSWDSNNESWMPGMHGLLPKTAPQVWRTDKGSATAERATGDVQPQTKGVRRPSLTAAEPRFNRAVAAPRCFVGGCGRVLLDRSQPCPE